MFGGILKNRIYEKKMVNDQFKIICREEHIRTHARTHAHIISHQYSVIKGQSQIKYGITKYILEKNKSLQSDYFHTSKYECAISQ